MQGKIGIFLGLITVAAIVVSLGFWVFTAGISDWSFLLVLLIPLLLVAGAIKILLDKANSLKHGLPAQDEFSTRVSYKAGYFAFFVAIYSGLALSFINDHLQPHLELHTGVGIIIAVSGAAFMISYFLIERKGNV